MDRMTFEGNFCDISVCAVPPERCGGSCSQRKVWERLKHYEDLEESGRLVVLPCKAGDEIYTIEPRIYNYEKHEGVQRGICVGLEQHEKRGWSILVALDAGEANTRYFYNCANFGRTVFLTREEAEKALEERK